jgi:outer membrane protein assembly factor BamB
VWSTSGAEQYGLYVAAADGRAYVTTMDATNPTLRALDDATGTQLWSTPVSVGDLQPAVAGGRVFIATTSTLYAFDAATGEALWNVYVSNHAASIPTSSPTVANGVVYLGSDDGRLYGFDAATGVHLFTSAATGGYIIGPAAIANGFVYAFSASETLWAFSVPATGVHLAASPALGGGFEKTEITKVSPSTKITVTNYGSATSAAVAAVLQGTEASQFRITNDGCSGRQLVAAGSCSLLVAFAPTTSGPKNATMRITAPSGGTFAIALSGLALAHPLVVTPPSKNFGNVPNGSATFTVSNPAGQSAGPVTLTEFWRPSSWSLTADTCSGKTLASSGMCTFMVQYSAGAGGAETGGVFVSTPDNAVATVEVSASG